MSRIGTRFESLRRQGRKGLIPYVAAGDPEPAQTVPILHALARAGADVIELGVPFSDPMADGPVVQRASERAIRHGVGLRQTLALVRDFRRDDRDTPVVLMGYTNPIERMGSELFAREAQAAGVDGMLVVDYPPEECGDFARLLRDHGIDPIFLLAPTSTDERIDSVARQASGFVYYVSLRGTTGAGHLDVRDVARRVPDIRRRTSLPVGVGFGIRDAASASAIAQVADAVVVGSRIIQEMEAVPVAQAAAAAGRLLAEFRNAIDQASPINATRGTA